MKKTNKTTYALIGLAIVLSALVSSLATRGAAARNMQDMDATMSSMQDMMGSMKSMMEQCEEMMNGDMGKMMTGMMSATNAPMAKPEGMSQEEHESHHQ